MKNIEKSKLDELIRLDRKYWDTGDTDILTAQRQVANEISCDLFGKTSMSNTISDAVGVVISPFGLTSDKSNQQVYKLFEALGFEVN